MTEDNKKNYEEKKETKEHKHEHEHVFENNTEEKTADKKEEGVEQKHEKKKEAKEQKPKKEEEKELSDGIKKAESQSSDNKSVKKEEIKHEHKHEDKKKSEKTQKPKKEEAVARGVGLRMSKKHGMYICSFIKGKKIDDAIKELQEVTKYKRAISFKGEIPHRKGKMMSGRYPIKAAGLLINMLKGLRGNVITNGMDLDKTIISYSVINWGARPKRRRGAGKRTNILIRAVEAGGKK